MERLRLAHEAWELARDRLTAFVQARHPDWDTDRIRRARQLSVGDLWDEAVRRDRGEGG